MWSCTHQIFFLNESLNNNLGATNSVIFSPFFLFFNIILLLCISILLLLLTCSKKNFHFPLEIKIKAKAAFFLFFLVDDF